MIEKYLIIFHGHNHALEIDRPVWSCEKIFDIKDIIKENSLKKIKEEILITTNKEEPLKANYVIVQQIIVLSIE